MNEDGGGKESTLSQNVSPELLYEEKSSHISCVCVLVLRLGSSLDDC